MFIQAWTLVFLRGFQKAIEPRDKGRGIMASKYSSRKKYVQKYTCNLLNWLIWPHNVKTCNLILKWVGFYLLAATVRANLGALCFFIIYGKMHNSKSPPKMVHLILRSLCVRGNLLRSLKKTKTVKILLSESSFKLVLKSQMLRTAKEESKHWWHNIKKKSTLLIIDSYMIL